MNCSSAFFPSPEMALQFPRVLVLGGNAFTASHFIDFLLEQTGCEVLALSRSPRYEPTFLPFAYKKEPSRRLRFQQLDINKEQDELERLCDGFEPGLVVNFAAQGEVRNSWKWPDQWAETNCMAVVRLTEMLRQKAYLKRYVAISTPEVYGNTGLDTVENETYRPSTPYATSKLAGDLHIQSLVKHYGFPAVFTRAANLYGIHQQLYRIVPRTVLFLKMGRQLSLHNGGRTERAFIHARDVASGTWLAATKGKTGEVYHIAPQGELRSIRSVVENICESLGKPFYDSVKLIEENYGQDARFSMDPGKAMRELGWKPAVPFEAGVRETVTWIEDNWEILSKQPLDYQHIAS